ncbi:MAG: DUF6290 family protein [Spirochaetes bacterium]|nr:DUF6290 family protein [Spirochaetota bacterium]
MAVISLRLNKEEENMVNFLADYYEQDRSSLIKHSLKELYEDIIDRQTIAEYELKEKEVKFIDSSEIIKSLKTPKTSV